MNTAPPIARTLYDFAGRTLNAEEMFIEMWIQNQDVPMSEEQAERARREARILPITEAWGHVSSKSRNEYAADMRRHLSEDICAEWVVIFDGRPVAYRFAA